MAIGSSRVQQGSGSGLMQQMSSEVVDLYKHFQNLTETRRQVDIMEQEQKAKQMGPMVNKLIKDRGGLYPFLQTGPEAQAIFASYLGQTAGLSPDEAVSAVKSFSSLDPSQADMLGLMMNAAAAGDKPAMQMVDQITKAGLLENQARSRGDEKSANNARELMKANLEKLKKTLLGANDADVQKAQGQAQAQTQSRIDTAGVHGQTRGPTQEEIANNPSLGGATTPQPQQSSDRITVGRWLEGEGALKDVFAPGNSIYTQGVDQYQDDGTFAQARGKSTSEFMTPDPSKKRPLLSETVADARAQAGSQAQSAPPDQRGMWSQNVSTKQAFERMKENGEIPQEMSFDEYNIRTSMPQGIQDSPEYVQDSWVSEQKKLLEIKRKEQNGEITPEAAGNARSKALMKTFQVQQEVDMHQAADRMTGKTREVTQEMARMVGESESVEQVVQKVYKNPQTRPEAEKLFERLDALLGPAFGSVIEDQAKGKKVAQGKLRVASRQAGGILTAKTAGKVNQWYANMVSTGAINNPVMMRQSNPDLAAQVDLVNQMTLAERRVDIAEDELGLRAEQLAWQKALKEEMMALEAEAARISAEDPAGALMAKLLPTAMSGYMDIFQKAIAEGMKPEDMQKLYESDPLLKAIQEGATNLMSGLTGVQLERIEEKLGFLAGMWAAIAGKEPRYKYATPGFLGGGGVNSAPVESGQSEPQYNYNASKWEY